MDTITLALAASAGTLRVPENRDPEKRAASHRRDAIRKRASRDFRRGKWHLFPYGNSGDDAELYQRTICGLIGRDRRLPAWLTRE
jgi:hypothetical protein